jgi:hypothetical protein
MSPLNVRLEARGRSQKGSKHDRDLMRENSSLLAWKMEGPVARNVGSF